MQSRWRYKNSNSSSELKSQENRQMPISYTHLNTVGGREGFFIGNKIGMPRTPSYKFLWYIWVKYHGLKTWASPIDSWSWSRYWIQNVGSNLGQVKCRPVHLWLENEGGWDLCRVAVCTWPTSTDMQRLWTPGLLISCWGAPPEFPQSKETQVVVHIPLLFLNYVSGK